MLKKIWSMFFRNQNSLCAMAFRTNVMFLKTFLVFYGPLCFNNLDGTIPNHLKFIFKYKHDLCGILLPKLF